VCVFFLIKQRLLEYVSTLSVFILQNNFIKHVTFCFFKIVKYSNFREDIVSTPILFFNDWSAELHWLLPLGLVKTACRCFENVVSVVDGGRGLLVQLRGQKVPG